MKKLNVNIIKPTKAQASAMYHFRRRAKHNIGKELQLISNGDIVMKCTNGNTVVFTLGGAVEIVGDNQYVVAL